MKSRLFKKRADVLNEELAFYVNERPASPDEWENPFASKTHEENKTVVAKIDTHNETKFLPSRPENQKHYDEEVKNDLEAEKEGEREKRAAEVDYNALALTPTEAKLLKLVQRKSNMDPIVNILPYSGMNSGQLLQALNNLGRKGWIAIKDSKPVRTDVTDRLVMTYDAVKSGAVVASWNSGLLLDKRA